MKKLFIVLAVASLGFVACNNDAEKGTDATDSTKTAIDSTADVKKDSVETVSDSVKSAIDSSASAKKDSLKSKM